MALEGGGLSGSPTHSSSNRTDPQSVFEPHSPSHPSVNLGDDFGTFGNKRRFSWAWLPGSPHSVLVSLRSQSSLDFPDPVSEGGGGGEEQRGLAGSQGPTPRAWGPLDTLGRWPEDTGVHPRVVEGDSCSADVGRLTEQCSCHTPVPSSPPSPIL